MFQRADQLASMRPPHYTGEDLFKRLQLSSGRPSFNEAPALHGGRPPWTPTVSWPRAKGFNEAPALHGGRPGFGAG